MRTWTAILVVGEINVGQEGNKKGRAKEVYFGLEKGHPEKIGSRAGKWQGGVRASMGSSYLDFSTQGR